MPDAVTYTATLPVDRATVEEVAALLSERRREIGTRRGRRALGAGSVQAGDPVLALDARRHQARPPGGRQRDRVLDELSLRRRGLGRRRRPGTRAAPGSRVSQGRGLRARDDRRHPDRHRPIPRTRPTSGVDLWWSGKHHHHGGNIQVITAPDGFPIYTSPVRPGREHDTTCARTHEGLLEALDAWRDEDHHVLADLGYEGERERMIVPVKKKRGVELSVDQQCFNALHSATRALAERGNALLKMTFGALRHVTISPGRIGAMTAAALVILQLEHHRTV